MLNNYCQKFSCSVAALLLIASPLSADLIHPDVMGQTVWYTAISEGTTTGDPLPLYGIPSISGSSNELTFPTTGNFAANSEAGNGPDQTDGKLTFMIEAKPGHVINGVSFEENGLASLSVPFGGDAFASVEAFAVISINTVAGIPVDEPSFTQFLSFDPDNEFKHSDDPNNGADVSTGWFGYADIPFEGPVTKVTITLDNILRAATTSDDGTASLMDKKEFIVRVPTTTVNVPEPTTVLLGCAFGFLSLIVASGRLLT